jgi:hypothetical protein
VTNRGFLLVYGIDIQTWAARHDLEPFSYPCGTCGASLYTSLPFAFASMRGLVAPRCECGNDRTPYCAVGFSNPDVIAAKEARSSKRRVDQRTMGRAHEPLRLRRMFGDLAACPADIVGDRTDL